MVQAIPNGKTQTRRTRNLKTINQDPDRYELLGMRTTKKGLHVLFKDKITGGIFLIKSPYGQPGDVLWVKETWNLISEGRKLPADTLGIKSSFICLKDPKSGVISPCYYLYKASSDFYEIDHREWKPSIFMPKEACRIRLLVKDVRVERLQDISEADAIAEGIEEDGGGFKAYRTIHSGPHKGKAHPWNIIPNGHARTSYEDLWESINGDGSWDKNPWVWVIEFEQIKKIIENGQK